MALAFCVLILVVCVALAFIAIETCRPYARASSENFSVPIPAVCINLPKHVRRKKRMLEHVQSTGLSSSFSFLSATGISDLSSQATGLAKAAGVHLGRMGCWESHVRVWSSAPERSWLLVLEDDALFCRDFNTKFENVLRELEALATSVDWDMCYLGRHPMGDPTPEPACERENKNAGVTLVHAKAVTGGTHAYLVRPTRALVQKLDWRNLTPEIAAKMGRNFAMDIYLCLLSKIDEIVALSTKENLVHQAVMFGSSTETSEE